MKVIVLKPFLFFWSEITINIFRWTFVVGFCCRQHGWNFQQDFYFILMGKLLELAYQLGLPSPGKSWRYFRVNLSLDKREMHD